MHLRTRCWQILEAAHGGDRPSRVFDVFLLTLIGLNVLAVVVGTVDEVQQRWSVELIWFERISVLVFSIEYVGRVWSAPTDPRYGEGLRGRLRFMITPMALVDLLAVLPFYLPMLGVDLRFVRSLRLMRFFRFVKLGRYLAALQLFLDVARAKREELVLAGGLLGLLLLLSASLIYFVENAVQPEAFSSIPAAMWWAVVTVTTVGYGDVYPVTGVGRLIGGMVAVLGIGFFALPTAILGSGFAEELERRRSPRLCPHCGNRI
jgi:voltage-gated potassium channel